jgi:hypothetical protein
MNGKLWVDEFVTHHRDLKEINEGFDDMHVSHGRFGFAYQAQSLCGTFADGPFLGIVVQSGSCIRCVVDMTKI